MKEIANFDLKVEGNDKKERGNELIRKIEYISLVYALKKFKEEKDRNSEYKLSEAVRNFTPTKNLIIKSLNILQGFDFLKNRDSINNYFEDIFKKIDDIYDPSRENIEEVLDFIILKKQEIKKYLGVENLKQISSNNERETNIFRFNEINNIDHDENSRYEVLKNEGFHSHNRLIELHVDNFYSSDIENLGLDIIKTDLALIATNIVESNSDVVAVVGKSWLLDTPIARRMGFKSVDHEANNKVNEMSVWKQFIDKNGNIDKKRFNKLIQEGNIPYRSVIAYMSTEDFLRKFLPQNKRGRIILKKIKKEKAIFFEKLKNELKEIKLKWEAHIKLDSDFNEFINNAKPLMDILDHLDERSKNDYLLFLEKMFLKRLVFKMD